MTFPLTPASPYVAFTTVITSAALNAYRVCINEALDGTGGGTYAPMAQLVLGGSGLKLTGATALELDGTSVATQDAGGIFNINGALNVGAGAYLDVEAGGTLSVAGTSASLALVSVGSYGVVQVGSGGALTVASGGTETVAAGGALNVLGGIFVGAGGGISVNGASGNPASLLLGQYSTTSLASGGAFTVYGTETVESGGSLSVLSGGTLTTDEPAYNANPGANTIKLTGVPKSWGTATWGGSSYTVSDGYNVSGVAAASWGFTVSFVRPMANANYSVSVLAEADQGTPAYYSPFLVSRTANGFTVQFFSWTFPSGDTAHANIGTPPFFCFQVCARST